MHRGGRPGPLSGEVFRIATITFDTLQFVRRLKAAGVPEAQAEAFAEAFMEAQSQADLATKRDLMELEMHRRAMRSLPRSAQSARSLLLTQFLLEFSESNSKGFLVLLLRLTKLPKIFVVLKLLLYSHKLVIREYRELLFPVLLYNLWVKLNHWSPLSSIRLPAMPDAIHNNSITLDFEQNTIVPNPQTILRSEIRQMLDVTGQIFSHLLDLLDNPRSSFGWKPFQVFYGPGLEAEIIFHFSLPSTPHMTAICQTTCAASP